MAAPRVLRGPRLGATLVEMIIVTATLGLLLGSVAMVSTSGSRTFRKSAFDTTLEDQGRRAFARIVEELQRAGLTSLAGVPSSPLWSDATNFDEVENVSAVDGSITWSPSRLEFLYEPGETNNGVDDNGNDLVDEGRIVLTRWRGLANEEQVVLARWVREHLEGELPNGVDDNGNGLVDERGLCFSRSGATLVIRSTLERQDVEGQLVTRTTSTTVQLRN